MTNVLNPIIEIVDNLHHGGAIAPISGGLSIPKPFAHKILLIKTYITGMFFVDNIEKLLEPIQNDSRLTLIREPNNEYDSRAILVKDNEGNKLGYIPRKHNTVIANLMDSGKLIYAIVKEKRCSEEYQNVDINLYMED